MKRVIFFCVVAVVLRTTFATVVQWDFPRTGGCHEGLAFSDGVTGVLVWGGGDTVNLTVARADLWDHRGGCEWRDGWNYTNIVSLVRKNDKAALSSLFKIVPKPGEPINPQLLPLGRVVVCVSDAELKRGWLDTRTGLGRLMFATPGGERAVDLAMGKTSRAFGLKFAEDVSCEVRTVPSMDHPGVRDYLTSVGFQPVERWSTDNAGGFSWRLPVDRPVSLGWSLRNGELIVSTSRTFERLKNDVAFERIRGESRVQWKKFWDGAAHVHVPDETVQRIYEYGMYRFGAMTDPDGVPAGLQGSWLEDDKMIPWNGDYHFNVNVQECYSPAYRGGHPENLLPLFRMIRSWWPRLRENARRFCGVEDGFMLPHSVDDRGVCIGGFWSGTIDHASTAWVADMMYRYVKYSGDRAFLRSDAYPFMRGAMNVYRAMMEKNADGLLELPVGSSPEWGAMDGIEVGRNPSYQLAAAHRLALDLIEAAQTLGERQDPMWQDVCSRLPKYAGGETGIEIFEGVGLKQSHRHHSHMAGLYPFNMLDLSNPVELQAVQRTYIKWIEMGTGWWTGWCVPWASILQTHIGNPDRAVDLLHDWDRYFTNAGHGSRHDIYRPGFSVMTRSYWDGLLGRVGDRPGAEIMQMDGMCGAATAVLELMVHEVGRETFRFRGCPESWRSVSFDNVLTADGQRISGRRGTGVAKFVLPDIFEPNSVILFQGDSITHGGRLNDMNHYMGHGYQAEIAMRYLAYRPELGLEFANRGISGDTSSNLVARWEGDAVPLVRGAAGEAGVCGWKTSSVSDVPDVISILIGINDYLRTDAHHVSVTDYEYNLRQMVTNSLAAKPTLRIVLCQPFRWPADTTPDFLARQAVAERVASEYNLVWVPFQELFAEILSREHGNAKYWFWDEYHPTYAAHLRMADFWLDAVSRDFARGKGRPRISEPLNGN